ncbi:Ribonuclease PH [Phycisphaerae bacterium RAS1]|nr:Ribonuclease PH [Phycisphaerae bacterium RAS1]
MRSDGRRPDQLRPVIIRRGFTRSAAGSVLMQTGETIVLCTASIEEGVPEWREASGAGWLTAEYDMLPASTSSRKPRNRTKVDGRTQEIQRLIGRSLRAAVRLDRLGPNTLFIDCDVLQADGGTRTASVTGAHVALCDAVAEGRRRGLWGADVIETAVAAVSVGIVGGEALLDLNYREDSAAEVDCNLVRTAAGRWIEVQATGERATFTDEQLLAMQLVGRQGIEALFEAQRRALAGEAV